VRLRDFLFGKIVIIASWNVNSVKMRLPLLLEWLKATNPDVVLLQELKCEADAFPYFEIESAGYNALVAGQKTYNGVAILTKEKANLRCAELPDHESDNQARYIEADYKGWILASIYLPNGNPVRPDRDPDRDKVGDILSPTGHVNLSGKQNYTEKFAYKREWMKQLHGQARKLFATEKPVVLGGDYNVIPENMDARHPENWKGDALFQPESRAAFRGFLNIGYVDVFRSLHPRDEYAYTFWDYQNNAWARDDGIRIDHLLASPEASDKLKKVWIDKSLRTRDKPSDHTPIVAEFNHIGCRTEFIPAQAGGDMRV
jgi:exodeoxyribonuclease-3